MAYSSADSALHALLLQGQSYKLPKGQVVHALDDRSKFNLIADGYVKRYLITNEGTESIQLIYGPGMVFPLPPLLKSVYEIDIYSGPETYYYESMTGITVYSVGLETLSSALAVNPALYKDLLYVAGTRLNAYIHRLEDTSLGSSTWRVAHQLVYLSDQFGTKNTEVKTIQLPLTHQDLANILNLSRETVSRSMSKLKDKQLIAGGNHITILDRDKLIDVFR